MRKFWETCNNYQVSKYILEEKKTVSLIYEHLAIFSSTSLLVLVHMKKKKYGICEKRKILSKSKVYDFCGYSLYTKANSPCYRKLNFPLIKE